MADLTLTDQNFKEEVTKSQMPVLVDFWAPWCGPCRIVGPIVEKLAEEFNDKLKVGKLNVDDNPQTSTAFGIMSIPSLLIFKNGQVVKTMIGAQGEDALRHEIEAVLK